MRSLPNRYGRFVCERECGVNVSRREALAATAGVLLGAGSWSLGGAGAAGAAAGVPAVEVRPGLSVYPRDVWGRDLRPRREFEDEDVRFLLVHHTATSSYPRSVRNTIRSIYRYHTRARGWGDLCYNFIIGPNGSVWEGRAGSMDRAVRADATGGSQGFAQLVCVIGNYQVDQPSRASYASLVKVLAWLADRHAVDTSPGATTTFVSRGSNRWAKGRTITTHTITGHRSMSQTSCPGVNLRARLPKLRTQVHAQRALWTPDGHT